MESYNTSMSLHLIQGQYAEANNKDESGQMSLSS